MITDDSRMQEPVPIAIEHPELVSYRAEFPNLHLVRSLAYYLLVAAYLILLPCDFAVAFSTVVLSISLSPALWKE